MTLVSNPTRYYNLAWLCFGIRIAIQLASLVGLTHYSFAAELAAEADITSLACFFLLMHLVQGREPRA